MTSTTSARIVAQAAQQATDRLLQERNSSGWWTGELSTSALSTATAVMALEMARRTDVRSCQSLIQGGLAWLAEHQNEDGGWGDTVLSHSNISTTMLVNAVFHAAADSADYSERLQHSQKYIDDQGGVPAIIRRYGKDRTFSVPILTHCALAGIVDWDDVIPLPFELACIPPRLYNLVRMPVVSYALPALIAIGQVIFAKRGHRNPLIRRLRQRCIAPSLKILDQLQPTNGGFLEATPLTSFVCMSLLGAGHTELPVTARCLDFIEASVRDDGSWPIDTNLTTWVTSLSVNAVSVPTDLHGDQPPVLNDEQRDTIRQWLLGQQHRQIHPFTQAAPGGWAWTDLPGGVPDADDTPGAILALLNLRCPDEEFTPEETSALEAAVHWLLGLQNRDGGWPTFCRGWGTLPFDQSSCDLTAHALRALHLWQQRVPDISQPLIHRVRTASRRGFHYLLKQQRDDGTWLPLWFGNQWDSQQENPLYGTSKVVLALRDLNHETHPACLAASGWLLEAQNSDGSWSARQGLPASVEETSLAIEALSGLPGTRDAVLGGVSWLSDRIPDDSIAQPSPIGFYFANLWYFERLYPIIFAVGALRRAAAAIQPD